MVDEELLGVAGDSERLEGNNKLVKIAVGAGGEQACGAFRVASRHMGARTGTVMCELEAGLLCVGPGE